MSLLVNWFPPSRENWELLLDAWQLFPGIAALQWFITWHPRGKTSIESRLNLPGKLAWATMEAPGFIVLLYVMRTLPAQLGIAPEQLPWQNWTMAGMFTIHYLYRSFFHPFLNPTMSPIHVVPWAMAVAFQVANGLALGGWLGGYGPVSQRDWAKSDRSLMRVELGLVIWGWGLLATMFHDDDLREIRRAALRKQRKMRAEKEKEKNNGDGKAVGEDKDVAKSEGKGQDQTQTRTQSKDGVDKVYMLPKNGLFHYVLYAHYFCEWVEWTGFWVVGGWNCAPARIFLVNSIANMLPRAVQGREWYVEKFGREAVGRRTAVIPGLV